MTLHKLTSDQLAAERQHYQALADDHDTTADDKRVAEARLVELDGEEARKRAHSNGHDKKPHRWAHVDLLRLVQESGCQLHEKERGKWTGDHAIKHGSKSGECLILWPQEGRWHCTSCRDGGDAAGWVAHMDGVSWKEAARKLEDRFGPPEDEEKGNERPPSQATVLVGLATKRAKLFHGPDSEAYATVEVGNHRETWALKTKSLKRWLAALYYDTNEKTPGAQALQDAVNVLEGQALFASPEHPTHTRLAEHAGNFYLDLGNEQWEAVEITPDGWRVVTVPPVRFRRARGMAALPRPVKGGKIEELRPFVNVGGDSDWVLLVAWLIATLRPTGPYPVLPLHGEQGSAKSTTERVLKSLVDPSTTPLRSEPKEARDLMIAATNGWIVAYDNLSHIPAWLSDAICRLATGGGFSTRELYTDSEEVLFEAQRPVLLNGIEELATRSDLLDRSIPLYLPSIPERRRKPEAEFWRRFETARPRILGALLDAVSGAMSDLPKIELACLPRMADFALWATAAERALGWERHTFTGAYSQNRASANDLALESSPIGEAMKAFVNDHLTEANTQRWESTATELLNVLVNSADERTVKQKNWPRTGRGLSGALRRIAPNLRASGIEITFDRREPQSGRRLIVIEKVGKEPSPPSPPSPEDDNVPEFEETVGNGARDNEEWTGNWPLGDSDGHLTGQEGDDWVTVGPDPVTVEAEPVTVVTIGDGGDGIIPTHNNRASYTLLDSPATVELALPDLLAAPVVGLDTETTGLDPHKDKLRLVQLATAKQVYILDAFKLSPAVLRPVLDSDSPKIVHNAKFDLQFLLANGLSVRNVYDTLLADQVLRNSRYPRKLSELCSEYLQIELDKTEQRSDFSGVLNERQLTYAARDGLVLLPLRERLGAAIEAAQLTRCLSLENRTVPAIAWLEYSGAPFDTEAWRRLADGALAEKLRLEDELTAMAQDALGNNTLFGRETNWEAPKQVLEVLRGLGLDIASTAEDELASVEGKHPVIAKLLNHREMAKRCGTYGLNVLGDVRPVTGRIHADWRQIGAESGRMACTKPNLQNVPRTPAYRACFRAPEGRALVKADYSQIELRIAAEIAGDRKMLEAYQRGEDLHVMTAKAILGKMDVTKDDRQIAKSANFGLLYGMGAEGFRRYAKTNYGVDLSLEQAKGLREKFFSAYPGLRAWHRRQPDGLMEIRTVCGRRRLNVEKFTEKLNTPVQGTGADGMKAALALLWETRDDCPSAVPVLAVHDEIVIECDANDAELASLWLVSSMRRAMGSFLRKVPVEVEAGIIADWSGKPLEVKK